MHFSKTYSQLLLTLPNQLRDSAIEYRQLKKLIKELVAELETLGLTPDILQDLLQSEHASSSRQRERTGKELAPGERLDREEYTHPLLSVSLPDSIYPGLPSSSAPSKVVYELGDEDRSGEIVPRLRVWLREASVSSSPQYARVKHTDENDSEEEIPGNEPNVEGNGRTDSLGDAFVPPSADEPSMSQDDVIAISPIRQHNRHDLLWNLRESAQLKHKVSWSSLTDGESVSSTTTISQANGGLFSIPVGVMHTETADNDASHEVIIPLASDTAFFRLLTNALESLSSVLSQSQTSFRIQIQELTRVVSETSRPASARGKSDLYTWRSIFQFYMEAQVFESTFERDRGELPIEDSEARLAQFARRLGSGGFKFQLGASRNGLERFLELNVMLLNLKKFQRANAEAARKILKKHAKRTALSLPTSAIELIPALELAKTTVSIPHVLIVSLTESLMPIIPVIEDYVCSICMSIAYKPIRLHCGHLFCVRCLVKMQRRGQDNCPMCRAPSVLQADKSNLDQALANFMYDWFPVETKQKAKENDLESTKEQMEELGLDTRCAVM